MTASWSQLDHMVCICSDWFLLVTPHTFLTSNVTQKQAHYHSTLWYFSTVSRVRKSYRILCHIPYTHCNYHCTLYHHGVSFYKRFRIRLRVRVGIKVGLSALCPFWMEPQWIVSAVEAPITWTGIWHIVLPYYPVVVGEDEGVLTYFRQFRATQLIQYKTFVVMFKTAH